MNLDMKVKYTVSFQKKLMAEMLRSLNGENIVVVSVNGLAKD